MIIKTLFIFLFLVTLANANSVGFEWASNKDHVLGYKIYYEQFPDVCGKTFVEIPIESLVDSSYPEYVLTDLADGTWYFNLSAYNDIGESECTWEIATTFDPNGFSGFIKIIVTGKK